MHLAAKLKTFLFLSFLIPGKHRLQLKNQHSIFILRGLCQIASAFLYAKTAKKISFPLFYHTNQSFLSQPHGFKPALRHYACLFVGQSAFFPKKWLRLDIKALALNQIANWLGMKTKEEVSASSRVQINFFSRSAHKKYCLR